MRTIPSSLVAAINSQGRTPTVSVQISDQVKHFTAYQSVVGTEGFTAICTATDGSIVRAYTDRPGGAGVATLFVQRITDPGNAAQWSVWTTLSSGNMEAPAGCALSNNGGTLRVFAQRGSAPFALVCWTSTDNGATWTGPTTVSSAFGQPGGGIGSAGNNDVFFLYQNGGPYTVGYCFYSAGAWSAFQTWSQGNVLSSTGLDVVWNGSQYALVIGNQNGINGYTLVAGNWFSATTAAPIDNTNGGFSRAYPRLQLFDGLYTLTYVEADMGSVSGLVYSYCRSQTSSDFVHWSEGLIYTQPYTLTPTLFKAPTPPQGSAGPGYYLSNNVYTLRAVPYTGSANQFVDVTIMVLSYQRVEKAQKAGSLLLTLSNQGGQYNSLGPLIPGATVNLAEGYKDPGSDTVPTGRYHILTYHFLRSAQHNELAITAADSGWQLDRESRYQWTYTNQTLSWLLAEVCAKVGLTATAIPGSSQFSNVVPSFTVQAGHTWRHALDDLCGVYSVYFFLDETDTVRFRELSSGDASVWTYGPELEQSYYGTVALRGNHALVTGKGTGGEAYDFPHITQLGQERVVIHLDAKLTTAAQCAQKAAFLLADEQRTAREHSITVPVHPGLQMYDVVTVNDAAAGISNLACRIVGIAIHYEPTHGEHSMTLDLEQV